MNPCLLVFVPDVKVLVTKAHSVIMKISELPADKVCKILGVRQSNNRPSKRTAEQKVSFI